MDTSPFAKLAPELRNCIYELVLKSARPFILSGGAYNTHSRKIDYHDQRHPLSLAFVCRQIYAECVLIFYNINKFVLLGQPTFGSNNLFPVFRGAIGKVNSEALGSVTMQGGSVNDAN